MAGADPELPAEAFFEVALDLFGTMSLDGRLLRLNRAWEDTLGYRLDELEGRHVRELIHPEDLARTHAAAHRAVRGEALVGFVNRYQAKDGSYRRLEWRVRRERDLFLMSARDLTEHRELEREHQRMLQRLGDMMALTGVGGWEVDLVRNSIFWDENTRAIHEVPEDFQPNLETAIEFYAPEARPVVEAQVGRAIDNRLPWLLELPLITYENRRVWVRAVGRPVVEDDQVVRLVGAFEDITVRKEHEDALQRARLAAEQASVAKSQFLANMSHEIRTPMAGVLGMLDAMLDDGLPEDARDKAAIARDSASALLAILNDILDYSKLESNEVAIERLSFDLHRLLEEVRSIFENRAAEKKLGLLVEVADDVPRWVISDPTRTRQILVNLTGNALKFTHRGEVRIGVSRAGDLVRFEVADTGIGLSHEQQSRLFRRFAQADDSTNRRYGGTGLGLAISKQLAELLGGSIGVDSVEGQGSTFWFTVEGSEGQAPTEKSSGTAQASVDLPALEILAAEDNRVNQMVLQNVLRRTGHRVTLVDDGAAALEAARTQHFDLILMDVQMPEMDGLEATRAIRALEPPYCEVPIVALTANAMAGDRERYIAVGMDEYASKPIDRDALTRAILRAFAVRGKSVPREGA